MKKTALAAAVALSLGTSAIAYANTAGLTGVWTGTYLFNMTSPGGAPVGGSGVPQVWTWDFDAGTVAINNTTAFYGSVWTAFNVTFTDNGTSYGGGGAQNMTFSWSVNPNIPVTSDWDVTATGTTAVVTVNAATILPTSSAFPGFHPAFSGNLTYVPVPAAVWLFGSGLLGLVGVARRRRSKV
mgnify:CR=1 FL=1